MTGRIDELETLADNSVERRTVLRGDYAPGITSCDEEADGAIGGGVMGGVIGAIVGGPVGLSSEAQWAPQRAPRPERSTR